MLLQKPRGVQNTTSVAFPAEHLQPIRPFGYLTQKDNGPHSTSFPPLLRAGAQPDMATVLTNNLYIVIARPPCRIVGTSRR